MNRFLGKQICLILTDDYNHIVNRRIVRQLIWHLNLFCACGNKKGHLNYQAAF